VEGAPNHRRVGRQIPRSLGDGRDLRRLSRELPCARAPPRHRGGGHACDARQQRHRQHAATPRPGCALRTLHHGQCHRGTPPPMFSISDNIGSIRRSNDRVGVKTASPGLSPGPICWQPSLPDLAGPGPGLRALRLPSPSSPSSSPEPFSAGRTPRAPAHPVRK